MAVKSGIILLVAFTLFAGTLTEKCSVKSPEYKEAGNKFYEAFNETVKTKLSDPNPGNKTKDELREKLFEFLDVANKSCKAGKLTETFNYGFFLEILDYSLRNVTALKELQMDGGFTCIDANKTIIDQCVSKSLINGTGYTNHTRAGRLMGKAHLKFDSLTCDISNSIRKCTLDILKTCCKPTAVNFVESLFEFTVERCKAATQKITAGGTSGSHKITGYWATIAMLALLNELVVFNF